MYFNNTLFVYVDHFMSILKAEGGLRGLKGTEHTENSFYKFVKRNRFILPLSCLFFLPLLGDAGPPGPKGLCSFVYLSFAWSHTHTSLTC